MAFQIHQVKDGNIINTTYADDIDNVLVSEVDNPCLEVIHDGKLVNYLYGYDMQLQGEGEESISLNLCKKGSVRIQGSISSDGSMEKDDFIVVYLSTSKRVREKKIYGNVDGELVFDDVVETSASVIKVGLEYKNGEPGHNHEYYNLKLHITE